MCKRETKCRPQASSTRLAAEIDHLFAVDVKHMSPERSFTPLRLPGQRLLRARGSLDKGRSAVIKPFSMAAEAQRSGQHHDGVVTIYG